jgi:hypothetical protein
MFKSASYRFQWKDLGDIDGGRPASVSAVSVLPLRKKARHAG